MSKEKNIKVKDLEDGSTVVSFDKTTTSKKEFYKNLASKTKEEFLIELGKQTYKLWTDIINYVIKKNIKEDKQVNAVVTFCDTVDVTMGVMRSLKQELLVRATQLDIAVLKETGKTLKFAKLLDTCIIILTPQEMMEAKKKEMKKPSYVA